MLYAVSSMKGIGGELIRFLRGEWPLMTMRHARAAGQEAEWRYSLGKFKIRSFMVRHLLKIRPNLISVKVD
jgi:hypothetical protein